MKINKLMMVAVAVMALGAVAFGVRELRAAGAAVEARLVASRRSEEMRAKIAALEKKLACDAKRAEAVESDNAALAGAVKMAQTALEKPAAVVITRERFAERIKMALGLGKQGDPDAGRRELLWCFDVAAAQPGLLAGGQMISIMNALVSLGERHPEVLADLRERFEAGKLRVLQGDDREPLVAMGTIARALKDDQAMVGVFDALPNGSPARTLAGLSAVEGLIAAKRYEDVLAVEGYGMMSSAFERITTGWAATLTSAKMPEPAKVAGRSYAVTSAAQNIEVLAGAGDLAHARELAARLLTFDGSEATRTLLQKHLERAGRPELLAAVAGK